VEKQLCSSVALATDDASVCSSTPHQKDLLLPKLSFIGADSGNAQSAVSHQRYHVVDLHLAFHL